MARKKMKLTGFARFLLVMVVLAPLAFIGASYYNGEDGLENLKNLFKGKFNSNSTEEAQPVTETPGDTKPMTEIEVNGQIVRLQNELEFKTEEADALFKENTKLKIQLEAKEKELEDVKAQLHKIKSALGN
jgi:hypothetical protein